jgi:hypothetical protein
LSKTKEKEDNMEITTEKCGTITVSVYKNTEDDYVFFIKEDNTSLSDISNILEKALITY